MKPGKYGKGEKSMAEAFRQGMYMYVGGMLFCIAAVILIMFVSSLSEMNANTYVSGSVMYDINDGYHYREGYKAWVR